jgi:hypothetical protein
MVTQIAIVILSAVGIFVIWYFFLRGKGKDVPEPSPDVPVSYLTPKGATVYSKVEVPASALSAIDDGLQATIDRMPDGWTGGRDLSEYKIQFVAPVGFTAEGVPYLVRGGIDTWGYVDGISSNDASGRSDHMVIVLPYQQDWARPDWVMGTVHSESEHWVERRASIQFNDPEIFWMWARAGADDRHPHRP